MITRTQVAIIGAGPAGLTLAHLLQVAGIESVVLENRSRDYVERRVRAGLLEQGTVDLLENAGVGTRLRAEGLVHEGIALQFAGERHRIALAELTGGKTVTIYGQTEIVKDLIVARLGSGQPLHFEVDDVRVDEIESDRPAVRFRHEGREHVLQCDAIAGCDGFHGVCRPSFPSGVSRTFSREYPFGWLGILASVAPSNDELVYAHHERGFALLTMRSPEVSRLYLQCRPDESIGEWPDERIWEELRLRLELPGWTLADGPISEKGITPMRSFVSEPLRHGRLFLAGDAAHIVPPTGAKGLNLAVNDVRILGNALVEWCETGSETLLDSYSADCLQRVWRAEHFSWWMTMMMHRPDGDDPFDLRLQESQLRYLTSSHAAATTLAENYVGLADLRG